MNNGVARGRGGAGGRVHALRGYGLAIFSLAIASLATESLHDPLFPTPLFFAAIVISTWFGGIGPGLLAVVLATLVLDYNFVEPVRTLSLVKPELPYLFEFALPALLTCWFVKKRRDTEASLTEARDALETRVQQRTAELSRMNEQLKAEIAERTRAEEAVQRTQAELAHVTRMMTIGELGASIAHEVNQPLMAVVVNGDACLQWLDRDPPNLREARDGCSMRSTKPSRATGWRARSGRGSPSCAASASPISWS